MRQPVTFDISDGDPPEELQQQADDVKSQIIESGRTQEEIIRKLQARVDAELASGTQTGGIMASAITPILESYKEQTVQNLRGSEPKENIDNGPESRIEPKGQRGRP
jgi:trans-2-enoyl-CoA reductase